MAPKPASGPLRRSAALACWVAAASMAQALLAGDIGRAIHEVERRIEMQLEGVPAPTDEPQPPRSHEDESIEPWELVSV